MIAGISPAEPRRIALESGAWIELYQAWLSAEAAARLHALLAGELAWEQRHIVLFGKPILQPRLIAWAGSLPYRYSGQTLEARAWPAAVGALLEPLAARLGELARHEFNHVLVNRYRDGNDSMGYHADAEPELGPEPVVASLSLGQTRRFAFKHFKSKERAQTLPLGSGSLLVMGGSCQRHYRHALLREPGATGERVSLTFRRLLRAPREASR